MGNNYQNWQHFKHKFTLKKPFQIKNVLSMVARLNCYFDHVHSRQFPFKAFSIYLNKIFYRIQKKLYLPLNLYCLNPIAVTKLTLKAVFPDLFLVHVTLRSYVALLNDDEGLLILDILFVAPQTLGVKFTNVLRAAFTHANPKSAKKLLNLTVFFARFWDVSA